MGAGASKKAEGYKRNGTSPGKESPPVTQSTEEAREKDKLEEKPRYVIESESIQRTNLPTDKITTPGDYSNRWMNGSIDGKGYNAKRYGRSATAPILQLEEGKPHCGSNGPDQGPIIVLPGDPVMRGSCDTDGSNNKAVESNPEEIKNLESVIAEESMQLEWELSVQEHGVCFACRFDIKDVAFMRKLWKSLQVETSKVKQPIGNDLTLNANKEFYENKIKFKPNGELIEKIHKDWLGNYQRLEKNHSYIQWLFPLPEGKGMNPEAQPLQFHEAKFIRENLKAQKRVVESYKMKLDFYGLKLADEKSGAIKRSKKWKERFGHLNSSAHSYRRITRIVKSIGILGFPHYTFPLVDFILHEAMVERTMPNLSGPCKEFWIDAVVGAKERHILRETYGLSMDKTNFASPRILLSKSYHEQPYDVTTTTRRDGVNGTQEADEEELIDNNNRRELDQAEMSKRGKASERSAKGGRKRTMAEELEDDALRQERDVWLVEHGTSRDDPSLNAYKEFYKNRIKFKPKGELIDKIHKDWFGDYRRLEINHSYIQCPQQSVINGFAKSMVNKGHYLLFPIPDSKGMNAGAQPLQFHEAMFIKENRITRKRVLASYKMMVDFYGMELANERTGEIKRSKNWKERFSHLNLSAHNYRRITRIVKSIGILGFHHYTFPLVDFILHEAMVERTLPNLSGPCKEFWIDAVVGAKERHILRETYGLSVDKTNFASPRILERSIGSAKQPAGLSSF